MLVEMKWMGFSERIKIVNWYLKIHDSAFHCSYPVHPLIVSLWIMQTIFLSLSLFVVRMQITFKYESRFLPQRPKSFKMNESHCKSSFQCLFPFISKTIQKRGEEDCENNLHPEKRQFMHHWITDRNLLRIPCSFSSYKLLLHKDNIQRYSF